MTDPKDSALRLAHTGLRVFRCHPDKRPATLNGFKAASNDPRVVRNFGWRSDSLIGLPTGAITGVDVLDIDPRHAGDEWLSEHAARLPATRTHRTRSGGLHLVFRHADGVRNSESRIAPGVDVRGDGGYVIFWPAHDCEIIDRSRAADWPHWLLSAALPRERPVAIVQPRVPARPAEQSASQARRFYAHLLVKLRTAPPGQRHYTLRNTALALGGISGELGEGQGAVAEALLQAVIAAGAEDEEIAAATIRWGLTEGGKRPLDLTRTA